MLDDIQAQINYYSNLALLVTDDNERLERIQATLAEIRTLCAEIRAGAEALRARNAELLAGLDGMLPPEERT